MMNIKQNRWSVFSSLKGPLRAGFLAVLSLAAAAWAQQTTGNIKGLLTDESGAIIPAAVVTLSGNGVQKSVQSQADGTYSFAGLKPGQYNVKVTFPGFSVFNQAVTVDAGATVQLPIHMSLTVEKQEVTVSAEAGPSVSVEPDNNATALVLRGDELAALPDDPDDLSDALQALAGPGAGPNGGQIYIDGFSGGELPPKESIREVRINQNPFSAEYDRLGFGRIEILTRPGTDRYRGTLFFNTSNAVFNSRNPFVDNKPDYFSKMFGGNFGGPVNKHSSFFFDFNRRDVTDNALVHATWLDPNSLTPLAIDQAVVTPNVRTRIAPRLDYQLSTNNTLVARFAYGWDDRQNQGIGQFRLPPSFAPDLPYSSSGNNQNLMLTETAVLNAKTINETRFQWARDYGARIGNLLPQINVTGAFTTGGNDIGSSYDRDQHYELQNYTSIMHGSHTIRFGVRLRRLSSIVNSPSGFGGTFSFFGGSGPVLDANNQPVLDASGQPEMTPILSIEQYRRTLLFQGLGYSPAEIRTLGGGASQFSISGGNPYASIIQYDAGPFVQDDWRVRPNLTLSLGLRYEVQTNVSDHRDIAPRLGFAWAPGSGNGKKTVIRGGFGIFYDRVAESLALRALQLNGTNQLSYVVQNPDFFPIVPSVSTLSPRQNSIYRLDSNLRAPMMMQSAIGIERQLPANTTVAVTYTYTRADHMLQTVNVNAPLPGTYVPGEPQSGLRPYGDAGNLFLYESGGLLRQHIMFANFNTRFSRNVSLQGNYSLQYANDLPSVPSNPYNFMQDWGRSNLDRRHRFMLIGTAVTPLNLRFSPMVILQSGAPYDVLLGKDLNGDTLQNDRPAFASAPGPGVVPTIFGDFNTDPALGSALVPRNYLTSAGLISVNMRVSRTFGFGPSRNQAPGGFDGRGGGFGGGHYRGPGGGGMRMGGGGSGGMFGGDQTEHRFNLTLSVMFANILNHVNPAGYTGILTSPQFGQPSSVNTGFGGGPGGFGSAANNRRIEMSLRLNF
jgi:hypothetical protein